MNSTSKYSLTANLSEITNISLIQNSSIRTLSIIGANKGGCFETSSFAVTFFLCIVVIVSFLGNTLVLVTFRISDELNRVSDYFIINLSISDLTVTIFSIPFWMSYVLIGWPNNQSGTIYTFWICLDIFCGSWSIMSLAMISIERYFCIVYPMHYENIVTKQRGITVVAFVLAYSTLTALIGYIETTTHQVMISIAIIVLSYVIPIIIKGFAYSKIYQEVKRQSKFIAQVEKDRQRLLEPPEGKRLQDSESSGNTPVTNQRRGEIKCYTEVTIETVDTKNMLGNVSFVRRFPAALNMYSQNILKVAKNKKRRCQRRRETRAGIVCSQLQKDGIEDWEAYMDELDRRTNKKDFSQTMVAAKVHHGAHEPLPVETLVVDFDGGCEMAKKSQTKHKNQSCQKQINIRLNPASSPRQNTNGGKQNKINNCNKTSSKRFKKETKGAKVIGAIIGTFLALWTPFILIVLLSTINVRISTATIMAVKCLHYANSAINPILYIVLNITLRKEVKKVLKKAKRFICIYHNMQ